MGKGITPFHGADPRRRSRGPLPVSLTVHYTRAMCEEPRRPRRNVLICVCLTMATVAPFWQMRSHDFVNIDDPIYITENDYVLDGLTGRGVAAAFTSTEIGHWHPLTWLSLMLDVELFGLNAGRHHLMSLLLHVANTLLLFLVLERMTGCPWRSAAVAAMFAIHPQHVEPVAWAASRKDVLSTFLLLLMLRAYVGYARKPTAGRNLGVAALFALTLTAKPMAVMAPLLLFLIDFWPLRRVRDTSGRLQLWKLLKEKWLLFLLMGASCGMTLLAGESGHVYVPYDRLPLWPRLAVVPLDYVAYLGRTFWPAGLAPFYPHPGVGISLAHSIGAALLLAALTAAAFGLRKRAPYLLAGWLWYIVLLVPVSGFIQFGSHSGADRYTYVPLIGIFIAVVWGISEVSARFHAGPKAAVSLAAVSLTICMACTWIQAGHWRSSVDLWRHAVTVNPGNPVAHTNLGAALVVLGQPGEAEPHFVEAVRINPHYPQALFNLGKMRADQGDLEEAERLYRAALDIRSGFPEVLNNLGVLVARRGGIEEGVDLLRKAYARDPGSWETCTNLGMALIQAGQYEEARGILVRAMGLLPEGDPVRGNVRAALEALPQAAPVTQERP